MKLTRRALTTGLAALATLAPLQGLARDRSQIAYRRGAGEPIRFTYDPLPYVAVRRVLDASDWRYQPVTPNPDDSRGIVRHLPSGLTFLTQLDELQRFEPLLDLHMASFMFADGVAPVVADDAHQAIARAAAYVACIYECISASSFYIPPDKHDADAVEEPPFIVGEIQNGFLLHI